MKKSKIVMGIVLLILANILEAEEQGKMIEIPAGIFMMGTNVMLPDKDYTKEAQPKHKVRLESFFIDKYEITQKDYIKLIGKNPVETKNNLDRIEEFKKKKRIKNALALIGDNYPVTDVSWHDAARYCNARSRKEGLEPCYNEETWKCDFTKNGYRLPTEAEWEYACRAGTDTIYYFGDDKKKLPEYANYWPDKIAFFDTLYSASAHGKDFIWNNPLPTLLPVGTKKPNKWDIYDMLGNAQEWCNDWYDGNYYKESPEYQPRGPEEGKYKVARGGGYNQNHACCAMRSGISPNNKVIGFRCVRNAPQEEKVEVKPVDKPEAQQPDNKNE